MSKLFSVLAEAGQFVCLYLFESKIGYMALKTTEDVTLALFFNIVSKSNIDINKNVFEIAFHKKQNWKENWNLLKIHQLIMKDHCIVFRCGLSS